MADRSKIEAVLADLDAAIAIDLEGTQVSPLIQKTEQSAAEALRALRESQGAEEVADRALNPCKERDHRRWHCHYAKGHKGEHAFTDADEVRHMKARIQDLGELILRTAEATRDLLVPESYLYPDEFQLQGTTTGAGMQARLDGNRIYTRNFDGLLQPIPGEVYRHVRTGRYFLVLATAEHRHHAVMDVVDYTGPMPTPEKS